MEPYEGREPYIFISYARKDAERVLPYLDALSGAGYRVWYDKGISAGDEWLKKLEEKVTNCAVFCPIFSQAFNDSYYCFRETGYACWQDKKIVPLYLEEVGESLRLMFRLLKSLQHLRLGDCNPAQFAERLERETAFKGCKAPQEPRNALLDGWQKVGQIQWCLDADGVLTITRNNDLQWNPFGLIPAYQQDPTHGGTTAPWALYREKIFSVTIINNIRVIGDYAFAYCENLKNVYIPSSVIEIGSSAFQDCKNLKDVHTSKSWESYEFEGLHIRAGLFKIDSHAFENCKRLTNMRIPDCVTEIGEFAFDGCESLTYVCIPDSVIKIGNRAFGFCKNLKNVEIPAGAEVGTNAFPEHTLVIRRDAP